MMLTAILAIITAYKIDTYQPKVYTQNKDFVIEIHPVKEIKEKAILAAKNPRKGCKVYLEKVNLYNATFSKMPKAFHNLKTNCNSK